MAAVELLHRLRRAGFVLAVEGERLRVRPQTALTEALRATIREHKRELLAALNDEGANARRRERLEVRWAREHGWLMVWDPRTQTWHEVPAHECPAHWRLMARDRATNGVI
jgi:hypothetical protein